MSQLNVRYYQCLKETSMPSYRCAGMSVGAAWETQEMELLPECQMTKKWLQKKP